MSVDGSAYEKSVALYSCLEGDEDAQSRAARSCRERWPTAEGMGPEEAREAVMNAGRWAESSLNGKHGSCLLAPNADGDEEEGAAGSNAATVVFHDVTLKNPLGGDPLLFEVNGILMPGKVTALLGSSDTEVNALMTLLAGVLDPSEYSGTVYYNKVPISNWYRRTVVGFARTNGVFCSRSLSVRQNLLLSIQLHLQVDSTDQALAVDRVIGVVGLAGHEKTIVSKLDAEHRLRMTIAQELLIDPTVLFVEAPTECLSFATSLSIMQLLRHIARTLGKTVVVTLQQPRWAVYNTVDILALVHGGRLAYFGKAKDDAIEFFQTRGLIWNRQYTPTDFLLQLCSAQGSCYGSDGHPRQPQVTFGAAGSGVGVGSNGSFSNPPEELPTLQAPPETDAATLSENFAASVEYQSYIKPYILGVVDESRSILRCSSAGQRAPAWPGGAPSARKPSSQSSAGGSRRPPRPKKRAVVQDPAAGGGGGDSSQQPPRMVQTRGSWDAQACGGLARQHRTTDYGTGGGSVSGTGTGTGTVSPETTPSAARGELYTVQYAPFKEPTELKRALILMKCNALRTMAYAWWYLLYVLMVVGVSFGMARLYYITTSDPQRALQNHVGVCYFAIMIMMLVNVPAASTLIRHRPVFLHQRASGSYGTFTYWFCTILWELVLIRTVMTAIITVVVYHEVSYKGRIGELFAILAITQAAFYTLSMAVGAIVPSAAVGSTVLYALFAFFTVTGGLLINSRSIPKYMKWLQKLSYFRYSYESLLVLLFHDQSFDTQITTSEIKKSYIDQQGFSLDDMWPNMYVMIGWTCGCMLIALAGLWLMKPPLVVARPVRRKWYQTVVDGTIHIYQLAAQELPKKMKHACCGVSS